MSFTKDDLKSGMVVEFRSGKKYMMVDYNGRLFGVGTATYFDDNKNEDLTSPVRREWDIMKVYEATEEYQLPINRWDDMQLIWERSEVKELTVAQLEEELGYKIKIVK